MNLLTNTTIIVSVLCNISPSDIPIEAHLAALHAQVVLTEHVNDNPADNARYYKIFPPQILFETELGTPYVTYHLQCDSVFHNLDNLDFIALGVVEEIVYPVLHKGRALAFIPVTQAFHKPRDYLLSWHYSAFVPVLNIYSEWNKIIDAQKRFPIEDGFELFAIRLERLPQGYFILKKNNVQYITPMNISIDEIGGFIPDEHMYYPFIEVECMIDGLRRYCLEHFGRPKGPLEF